MGAILNFFFPGLGHCVHGKVGLGILWFLGTLLGYVICIVPGIVAHVICVMHGADLDRRERQREIAALGRIVGAAQHQQVPVPQQYAPQPPNPTQQSPAQASQPPMPAIKITKTKPGRGY